MKKIEPMYSTIIIGTGFGGLSAAINLKKLHINDFVMLERRSFCGGTWRQNRYPGAAVDVPSPLYSFENEPYPWSRLYAKQAELEAYTLHLIDKHELNEKILLNSEVLESRWVNDHWRLTLSNGNVLTARTVINATGPLSTPVVPNFQGKDTFSGLSFHCNDWPKDLSIKGKKVAIVGSGASAIQIIPAIVEEVDELHVFQRTPHWILPRIDFSFAKWVKPLLTNKWLYGALKWSIYVHHELRVLAFKYSKALLKVLAQIPAIRHLKKQIKDDTLRNTLTPNFMIGCKRILMSNTYYPALQKHKVTLHNKDNGIQAINEHGILTNQGEQVDVDLIVYATGFDAADSMISYSVIGRNNIALKDQWRDYPRAYLGTSIPNFPNFFVVTGPNTGIGHTSAIFVIESQIRYINICLEKIKNNPHLSIEPTEYAEDEYTKMVHSEMTKTVWHYGGCQSWYQNASGKVIAMFPGFSFTFRKLCKRFKSAHHLLKEHNL
ncbi:flavin-containing monooxygenase [Glaciecola sp. SC05]|uniref:flavin-containing monooxygenase n=1 Tax=Glaciecola sp. SC05 TaxID=1987355 RepID=UPI003528DC98